MTQFHDVLQEHVFLSLCVHLSCYAHQVALIYREFAQHACFQTRHQVALIYLTHRVFRANLFHKSHRNGTFHLSQQTHLVCHQVALIYHHLVCHQVALIDQKLVWELVGLVGRMLHVQLLLVTVEQLYRVVVVQLQNPIELSLQSEPDRVVMRSSVVVEETCMISHIRLLQSSI